jgi:hypothetical protein
MQLLIIIMMPTVVFNAREVFEQQGLGRGDQSHNRFYTSLQATMDTQRKQSIQEMKTIPGNIIGGKVRKQCLVHTFDKDMHHGFGSMGSGNPLTNEVNSGEDERGTFSYFLILKPIIQEVVEVFRSAKPKSCSTQRREEEMDTEAAPSHGADPELLATMRALATSIQTMQVGQQRIDNFWRQLQSINSKTKRSCMIVLCGVPYCGLLRHKPLRRMRCLHYTVYLIRI